MKKIIFTLITLFFLSASYAQILNPVTFNYSVVKKGNDLYEVHVKAMIEPKWHIYSVKNPDGGAQATEIKINDAKAVGAIKENGKMKTMFEKEFNVDQKYFESSVDFVQLVKLKKGDKITGTINYMVCNDRQCLPPKEVEFKIKM
ncbi:MAG TPA: protein-disulfide reductase DsbD domain-containing protein [Chitinophagaceae bacterium]|jgi:thiol:disulfide interchange protein DsbD